jgi:hypothetical protein
VFLGWKGMTKKRENSADRLVDMLELIHSRRYSGLLSVERFMGGRFEEGELYFEMGHPVYAHTGHKSGSDAFARLVEWRQVYFCFDKDAPHPSVSSENQDISTSLVNSAHSWTSFSASTLSEGDRIIPRKLVSAADVRILSLTRRQRLVYLLVDGKRTIADLARCLGKSTAGVRPVLDELQKQGLILM